MTKIHPDLTGIKNIIFDLGRVLLNINPLLTQIELSRLGYRPDDESKGAKDDEIVIKLECGKISAEGFINAVKAIVKEGTSSANIINAWNAMLLDFPVQHVNTLRSLGNNYKIYLLSNSNQIHFDCYTKTFRDTYGFDLSDLFDKMWFSFQIGIVKPEPEIFTYVLQDGSLKPEETLFIDDTLMHVEAARKLGIRAFHLEGDQDISELNMLLSGISG